jgi:hypothetical protein
MSLNVLVIPEDFRKDQYILQPLVERMFAEVGKPRARVRVCTDPLLGGIDQALDVTQLREVIEMYPVVQIFLLIVDRDGKPGRRESLDRLERELQPTLATGRTFLGENAWQEIEVWAIAGQSLPAGWKWADIRAENHPKELYFEPLAAQRDLLDEPGAGRTTMGREAAAQYDRVRSRCPEDIQRLEQALQAWLAAN